MSEPLEDNNGRLVYTNISPLSPYEEIDTTVRTVSIVLSQSTTSTFPRELRLHLMDRH